MECLETTWVSQWQISDMNGDDEDIEGYKIGIEKLLKIESPVTKFS